jgi:hypothetical protein
MDDDDRKTLARLLHISEQNNRILRRIRREMVLVRLLHLSYWFLILGLGILGYYYLTPYISNIVSGFVK